MKLKIKHILIFILIMFILLATLVLKTIKVNSKCLENPFTFGARQFYEENKEVITCSCVGINTNIGFSFDKDSIHSDIIKDYIKIIPNT